MKKLPLAGAALLTALLLVAALCVHSGSERASARLPRILSGSFPVRLRLADDTELELPSAPQAILPANAAWVDFVSLLIGPERVRALPEAALGYSRLAAEPGPWARLPRFTGLEAEKVLALQPDLVLAHTWQNPETLAALRRAGLRVLVVPVPESWEEIASTLELLGTVLGEGTRAQALAREHEQRRAALRERGHHFEHLRALSYTNLGAGGWTSGTHTTAQVLLELAQLRNAAGEVGIAGDAPADQEFLLTLAPDLFVVGLPDRSELSPPSRTFLLGEPALAGLEAIRRRRIVALPPSLFSTASPELLRGAERLADEVERLFADPGLPLSAGAAPGVRPGGE